MTDQQTPVLSDEPPIYDKSTPHVPIEDTAVQSGAVDHTITTSHSHKPTNASDSFMLTSNEIQDKPAAVGGIAADSVPVQDEAVNDNTRLQDQQSVTRTSHDQDSVVPVVEPSTTNTTELLPAPIQPAIQQPNSADQSDVAIDQQQYQDQQSNQQDDHEANHGDDCEQQVQLSQEQQQNQEDDRKLPINDKDDQQINQDQQQLNDQDQQPSQDQKDDRESTHDEDDQRINQDQQHLNQDQQPSQDQQPNHEGEVVYDKNDQQINEQLNQNQSTSNQEQQPNQPNEEDDLERIQHDKDDQQQINQDQLTTDNDQQLNTLGLQPATPTQQQTEDFYPKPDSQYNEPQPLNEQLQQPAESSNSSIDQSTQDPIDYDKLKAAEDDGDGQPPPVYDKLQPVAAPSHEHESPKVHFGGDEDFRFTQTDPFSDTTTTTVITTSPQVVAVYRELEQPPTLITGDHYFMLSVFNTFFCCIFGGWLTLLCTVPAIFFSLNAQTAEADGDIIKMNDSKRASLNLNMAAIFTYFILWSIYVVIIVITVNTST